MPDPVRIALVGSTWFRAEGLARYLTVPHEFVTPADGLQEVDVVVALRFGRADAERFACRLLHIAGAGADGIDFAALPQGCTVCNVFEHEVPMAEFVMAAILDHAIGFAALASSFDPATWPEQYRTRRQHREVAGTTLGLIGYGHVGRQIASRARSFGMRVHAVTHSGRAIGADWFGGPDQMPELLAAADYLVVACPLTESTRGLVDARALGAMKPTAVLINIARGEIVDEEALYHALAEGRIGGAALDVWYAYPTPGGAPVLPSRLPFHTLPNVRCTPHASAWTAGTFERRYAFMAENIRRLHDGEALKNVIWTGPAEERS